MCGSEHPGKVSQALLYTLVVSLLPITADLTVWSHKVHENIPWYLVRCRGFHFWKSQTSCSSGHAHLHRWGQEEKQLEHSPSRRAHVPVGGRDCTCPAWLGEKKKKFLQKVLPTCEYLETRKSGSSQKFTGLVWKFIFRPSHTATQPAL